MIGHLGTRTSALLDGQLPAAEAERLWAHVHGCHLCRDLVEREAAEETEGQRHADPPAHVGGELVVRLAVVPRRERRVVGASGRRQGGQAGAVGVAHGAGHSGSSGLSGSSVNTR